ncbi:alpha/beta hydrolase [Streptomyces purpureus]|uniref:Peptidase S33 tripeptidyl aminopeptidase-like C-terminal domain-containing protein n=1 Tax=Streptomyces purpureus TaxID=1951 RepID=A0A918LQW8_9ACTN|nr:hypothetical protein GCM10014713_33880 [Streptomyces purpureus]
MLRQSLQNAFVTDGAFPAFARLVRDAKDPAAVPALTPDIAYALPDTDAAITVAVICNDVKWPGSVPGHRRAVLADRAAHPLTAGMPANITPCSFWKSKPTSEPTRITSDGPSNILMIQSLRDPATPHHVGLKMRQALGDRARLVLVDQGGHGMYLTNGNACGNRAVTDFLTTGARPYEDTHCAS